MTCKSLFITATGTDIGKTYISALIVKKMREFGFNCGYYKPALSGAIRLDNGDLLPGDCDFVLKTAGLNINPKDYVSYCFEEAVSPHLAAKRKGVEIKSEVIKNDFENNCKKYNYLVVEGAGGITCPFNISENNTLLLPQIINNLGLKILIVADGGLGTINSVLLTVEYAKNNGLEIAGIIFNNFNHNDFMHIDNKIQVEKLTGINVLATVEKGENNINISQQDLLNLFA